MKKKVEKKPAKITKGKPPESKKPSKPKHQDQEKHRILEALRQSEEKY